MNRAIAVPSAIVGFGMVSGFASAIGSGSSFPLACGFRFSSSGNARVARLLAALRWPRRALAGPWLLWPLTGAGCGRGASPRLLPSLTAGARAKLFLRPAIWRSSPAAVAARLTRVVDSATRAVCSSASRDRHRRPRLSHSAMRVRSAALTASRAASTASAVAGTNAIAPRSASRRFSVARLSA